MITWFAITIIAVALLAGVVCLVVASKKSGPNDYVMGATLLVGLLLIAQVIVSIVAPFTGNTAVGDPLEFWMYLIVAMILPFAGGAWALIDRTRAANVVLAVLHLAVAVMTYRMFVIWG